MNNMKRFIQIITGTMFICFGLAIGIFYYGNRQTSEEKRNWFSTGKYNAGVNQEEIVSLKDVDSIEIETSSEDIHIIPVEGKKDLKAHFHGEVSSNTEEMVPELIVQKSGNNVTIRVKHKNNISFGFYNLNVKLDIYLPMDFNKNMKINTSSASTTVEELKLEKFEYNASSGDFFGNKVEADQISMKLSSGKIQVDTIYAKEKLVQESTSGDITIGKASSNEIIIDTSSGKIKIGETTGGKVKQQSTSGDMFLGKFSVGEIETQTSSGKIEVEEMKAEILKHQSTSGDFTIKKGDIKKGDVRASSGNVIVKNSGGDINIETTSGDITADSAEFNNNNLKFSSSSGKAIISLQKKAEFYLKAETSSGNINSEFPITIKGKNHEDIVEGTVGGGKGNIKVNTSSGDIDIKVLNK